MVTIEPSTAVKAAEFTKLICPACGERVQRLVLVKGSKIDGLKFKCKKCGKFWSVKAE